MDRTRKYHPEWDNPIIKEHIWYALTDKWILAQKLRIPKIQFTDHMKLKKKEGHSVGASVLLIRGNQVLTWGNMETKCGRETEGKAVQRLLYLGIHLICSHQTGMVLRMPRSACWLEPYMSISWEALPELGKYRGGCSQPTIGLNTRSPMEELEKELKELKGFAAP